MQPWLFFKNIEYLFNNVLGKDGLICDDVGWWSGFNKGGNSINGVGIGLNDIVEGMGTNNQITSSHEGPIGYSTILIYGGIIT